MRGKEVIFLSHFCSFISSIMTKQEAISIFKDEWNCYIKFQSPEHANDVCTKRQAFVQFIDQLHRDGEITDRQANSWDNPF